MVLVEPNIYFARESEDVILPSKREEDGCYDLYAYFPGGQMAIPPGETRLIPTGIHSAMTPHHRIAFRERSSIIKWPVRVRAGQIDSGYRGEWKVALQNFSANMPVAISKKVTEVTVSDDGVILYPYSKAICQFAVEAVPLVKTVEIELDELMAIPSERGPGAWGSSKK